MFILSKVLLFLLFPFNWIFVLFVIACIAKKRKQQLLILSVVLLYLFSIPLIIGRFASAWDVNFNAPKNTSVYSCAIVLGGFSSEDKSGNGYFNGYADRFIQAVKLLQTGKVKHLLITGGNGNLMPDKFREAPWTKAQLEALKVPDSCILIEGNSRNTIENAEFSKTVLQKAQLKPPYLLVTSAFHLRRALMIFKHKGYDVVPYPCNYISENDGFSLGDLMPDAGALSGWNIYDKEVVGYIVDYKK